MFRFAVSLLFACVALAQDNASSIRKVLESELNMVEHELVPLAEAVPAEKFAFAPTHGSFDKARTFGQQVTHIAAVIYACSAAVLGEKNPIDMGAGENGPATLQTRDDMVKFLKDSLVYAHKALATVTDANATGLVTSAFDAKRKVPRLSMADVIVWHTMDHYGQMAVYARMNGVVPPASRQ